jgi:hypothetical protein
MLRCTCTKCRHQQNQKNVQFPQFQYIQVNGLHNVYAKCHFFFYWNCPYQGRKVRNYVFVCNGYRFCLFLRFWYLIFYCSDCGSFCFSFHFNSTCILAILWLVLLVEETGVPTKNPLPLSCIELSTPCHGQQLNSQL